MRTCGASPAFGLVAIHVVIRTLDLRWLKTVSNTYIWIGRVVLHLHLVWLQ